MNRAQVVGPLDPNFGWTGSELITDRSDVIAPKGHLRGAYACASISGRSMRLIRDPLGLGKLFWAESPVGDLLFSARPWRLVEAGCAFRQVRAFPPGSIVDLDLQGGDDRVGSLAQVRQHREPALEGAVEAIASEVHATVDRYCAALAGAHSETRVFVCLSGGLDSTGVALFAQRHFRDVVAVSFDIARPTGGVSADRRTAERLARDLKLPLLPITPSVDQLLDGLDLVLREAIDWRDFNVHAGLVNHALAAGIAAIQRTQDALVLTGDFPNEFLVDYHAEEVGGETFYALPRLTPPSLQLALVRGLETSHRETGPFQAHDLAVVQIYGAAVDHYLALPAQFLNDPCRKERFCRLMFGDAIPEYVYSRPKTRAQIGDAEGDGGVLGICLAQGIDAPTLRRRFAELHGANESELERFIRGGRYFASLPRTVRV